MDLIPKQYKQKSQLYQQGDSAHPLGLKSKGIFVEGSGPSKFSLFFGKKTVILSFVLAAIALLVWGAIKGVDFYLQNKIEDVQAQIKEVESRQDIAMAQKIIAADKTLSMVEELLVSHIYSSQFFSTLESITLPHVQWLNLNLNTKEGTAALKGRAASYSTLATQIVSFKEANFQIDVSGVNLTKDGVEFSANIKFDPKILEK